MSDLTEIEILDCMRQNLCMAAEDCTKLATSPYRGFIYDRFRQELKMVEGCCRQIAYWRDGDARWLPVGLQMAEAHQRAGNWLRTGRRDQTTTQAARKESHPLFQKLAENLLALLKIADGLATKRTGVIGSILPAPLPGPHRSHRPVQVKGLSVSKGGIILPAGFAA